MRLITLILLISHCLYGQYDHQSIFPDLEGNELLNRLAEEFTPTNVLSLSEARDTLYARVHFQDDSVRCIYSGLSKYLNRSEDPSQFLFEEGGRDDLNLEHCYPRSAGSDEWPASADMHHLYPSRVDVNQARGSNPLLEIIDNEATSWYYKEQTRSNPPPDNIDLYSERTDLEFEPKERSKGDVARAYFYFYTVYRDKALAANPDFFSAQVETLCQWHDKDPVDSIEWLRNQKIKTYQGTENPFILDCRLARLYCNEISAGCRTVKAEEVDKYESLIKNNIVVRGDKIFLGPELARIEQAVILNSQGSLISQIDIDSGIISTSNLRAGVYYISFFDPYHKLIATKMVVII